MLKRKLRGNRSFLIKKTVIRTAASKLRPLSQEGPWKKAYL